MSQDFQKHPNTYQLSTRYQWYPGTLLRDSGFTRGVTVVSIGGSGQAGLGSSRGQCRSGQLPTIGGQNNVSRTLFLPCAPKFRPLGQPRTPMFRPLGQPRTPLFRPPDTPAPPNRPHRGGPEQDDPDASCPAEAFIEGAERGSAHDASTIFGASCVTQS